MALMRAGALENVDFAIFIAALLFFFYVLDTEEFLQYGHETVEDTVAVFLPGFPSRPTVIPRSPEDKPNSGGVSRVVEYIGDAVHTHRLADPSLDANCLSG